MPIDFVDSLVADPMGFLASNCVMMAGAVSCPAEAVGNFIIAPYTGETIIRYRNWGKKTGHYYEIRQYNPGGYRPPDSEDFEAIWSGYAGGHATHCELPVLGKRSVMLTPRLDGCTLTWLQRPDGSARFGHYNLKSGKNTMSQDEMRQEAIDRHGTDQVGTISKEYYYNKAKRANADTGDKRTVANAFGVRTDGGWQFYIQYIEPKGATLQIRGVELLRPARWYNLERY